jgi:hypothetical protein
MPRNSSGTMTAPTGQPVIGGTPILASTFNTLVNDIVAELTDSLSRSGKGGMLAPFKHSDGTVGDPSITFTNSPTSGLYRAGADDIGISIGGADLMRLSSTLIKLIALVTDGASAVGVEIDTANALADAGAKLLRVLNGAVEKFYLDKDGNVQGGGLFQALAAVGATLKGNVADGATAVGVILDNVNALADAAAKAVSVRVAGAEQAYFDKDGRLVPAGIDLLGSALQTIIKGGTGGLDIGTSIASDLRILLNSVAQWTFRESDGSLVANSKKITGLDSPTDSSDGATKGYVDTYPTPVRPTVGGLWMNGTGAEAVGYWRTHEGIVHLMGSAFPLDPTPGPMFTLPAGFRPAGTRRYVVPRGIGLDFETIKIESDGDVLNVVTPITGGDYFLLDPVSFLAEG